MLLWGALAIALAVYDAHFTCESLTRYGVVAEINPGVRWFASRFGYAGIYASTILPTLAALVIVSSAHSHLGLGFILGVRLCLFHFQRLSSKLLAKVPALNSSRGVGTPPPHLSEAS